MIPCSAGMAPALALVVNTERVNRLCLTIPTSCCFVLISLPSVPWARTATPGRERLPSIACLRIWAPTMIPLPIQYICCSHNRLAQASGLSRENYRHYLAAYYFYLELVDRQIGEILAAPEWTEKQG